MSFFKKKAKGKESSEEELLAAAPEEEASHPSEDEDLVDQDSSLENDSLASFSTERGSIFRVGNIDYAVGLLWQPVEDERKAAQEAKRMAQKEGMEADFFSHPFKQSLQVGLGSKDASHKAGQPSLAAHLLNSLGVEQNTIALFTYDGAWYLLATRGGAILSQTDRVFLTESEAIDHFNQLYSASDDWNAVYAPEAVGLSEADATSLDDLLTGKPTARLRALDSKPMLIRGGVALLAVAGLAFGAMQAQEMFFGGPPDYGVFDGPSRPMDPPRGVEGDIQLLPPAPWAGQPSASSFIVACSDAFDDLVMSYPGWDMTAASCTKSSFNRFLQRDGGTINWLEPYIVERLGEQDAVIHFASLDEAIVQTPIMNDNRIAKRLKTQNLSDVAYYLVSHMDEIDHQVSLDKAELTEEQNVFFDAMSFEFRSGENPLQFLPLLSRVPSLVVEQIVFDLGNHSWRVEGKIYETRSQPLLPDE